MVYHFKHDHKCEPDQLEVSELQFRSHLKRAVVADANTPVGDIFDSVRQNYKPKVQIKVPFTPVKGYFYLLRQKHNEEVEEQRAEEEEEEDAQEDEDDGDEGGSSGGSDAKKAVACNSCSIHMPEYDKAKSSGKRPLWTWVLQTL